MATQQVKVHVDLTDPSLFEKGRPHDVFAWLRDYAPLYWHEEPDGGGFWVVTRHSDILTVYSDVQTFCSRYGMRLGGDPAAVAAVAGRMLIVSDPPDHNRVRSVLARAFTPSAVATLEHKVRAVVMEVLDQALTSYEVDFVQDVARTIPNHVVCAMMGIPRSDWDWMSDVSTEAIDSQDPETRASAHAEIFLYFTELLKARREAPGDDLLTFIANHQSGKEGNRLTDEEVIFNCNGILAGANETTRYSASGGVLALVDFPDQWKVLRNDPDVVPAAVEEVLRWTTPGVHALRTVMLPTEMHSTPLAVSQKVTVWNVSANRDERVFQRPDQFSVSRKPNPHVAFGHGRHSCLGAWLARLELHVLLDALRVRVRQIELVGEPTWNSSNFTWGLRRLPVRLVRADG